MRFEFAAAHLAMRVLMGGTHEARDVVELCERILAAVEAIVAQGFAMVPHPAPWLPEGDTKIP